MATVRELGRLRYWLEELRDVRKARDVYFKLAEELRVKAVVMIVNTLWNRYRADIKGVESPPSFATWLQRKKKLENTYNKRFGPRVRRRWATWQIETALNAVLMYSFEEYDSLGLQGWFIDTFNELVNDKQPNSVMVAVAAIEELLEVKPRTSKELTEIQRRKLTIPAGTSLSFTAELRPQLNEVA